jgi:FkbM family methyltransferase
MRLKDIPALLGIKPRAREYGIKEINIHLKEFGDLKLAQWMHPKAGKIDILPDEVNELRKFLKPGDTVIDIGAYTGDTALPLALVVEKSGTVLALEPNRYVFRVLERNAALIQAFGNIIPIPYAATPSDCHLEFEYSDPGFCNGGYHEGIDRWKHGHVYKLPVEGVNLVGYLQRHHLGLIPTIRYIKVDAEGFDYSVLESLSAIIAQQKPFIRVEVFKHTDLAYRTRLYRFLKNFNYTLYKFGGAAMYKGELVNESDLMNWKHFDLFAIPGTSAS